MNRDNTCRVVYRNRLPDEFPVATDVKQGCVLSPILFATVLVELRAAAIALPARIQWELCNRLEDLDYADDICLLSHTFADPVNAFMLPVCFTSRYFTVRFPQGQVITWK